MADQGADPFPKLGTVYRESGSRSNQWRRNGPHTKLNSEQSGGSRVDSRQPQNMSGGSAPRPWFSQNSGSNAWGHSNVTQKLGKWGNGESAGANSSYQGDKSNSPKNMAFGGNGSLNGGKLPKMSSVASKPEKGLYSLVGPGSTPSKDCKNGQCKDRMIPKPHNPVGFGIVDDEIDDSESEIVFDSDDDFSFDGTDSDTGERSHEGYKKSRWFRKFFDDLNRLTNEEITSQEKPWHCPACQGGAGAIDWYQGLQPLLNHSKTIKSRRVRLHRLFAETLEEECSKRGVPLTTGGDIYGRWEGLDKKVKDHEIVWPPMVVVMNTRHEQDETDKWRGMGNQELLDCFDGYAALKARHSYGPQGHRGMSVLIFELSAAGYLEALRLHKHFKEQGRDREAWNRCQNRFVPGGKRQLYGYLASRQDMEDFNRHSQGKSKLKFEMKSYQEMVESKIKDINDDSHQLSHLTDEIAKERSRSSYLTDEIAKERSRSSYLTDEIAKERSRSQVLTDTLCKVSEKLRLTTEENRVVRERTKEQHQQNKEEMDAQENFFQDQIQIIEQTIVAKEDEFEKLQQAKREKVKQSWGNSFGKENKQHRVKYISSFIRLQNKEMRQFEAERDNIVIIHEEKKLALMKKQWQEQLELEKELENELTQLMNKYTLEESGEGSS